MENENPEPPQYSCVPSSSSTTSMSMYIPTTGAGGGSGEFQMNLLLQLQQNMLNFQSQLTELSMKLIQLEGQQQRLNTKVEENVNASACQVSSSSTSSTRGSQELTAAAAASQTMADDIVLLAQRVLDLENKVDSVDKQQQEHHQQLYAITTTGGMSVQHQGQGSVFYAHDGVFEDTGPGMKMESMEPEIIVSEFDPSAMTLSVEDVESYGATTSRISRQCQPPPPPIANILPQFQPPPAAGAQVAKPFMGQKWFTDKLGNRHDFEVENGRFHCPNCVCSYSTKPYLLRHFNEKHCDSSKHKCAFCGLIIDISDGPEVLVAHVKSHEDENAANDQDEGVGNAAAATFSSGVTWSGESQRFSCKVCPNSFAKAQNLACHYTISHYQAALDNLDAYS